MKKIAINFNRSQVLNLQCGIFHEILAKLQLRRHPFRVQVVQRDAVGIRTRTKGGECGRRQLINEAQQDKYSRSSLSTSLNALVATWSINSYVAEAAAEQQ